MKKIIITVLTLALILSVSAACNSNESADAPAEDTQSGNDFTQDTPPASAPDTVPDAADPAPDDSGDGVSPAVTAEIIALTDFEDGTTMGWGARGSGTLTVSQDVAKSGGSSLLVTDREQSWNGPEYRIDSIIEANVQYDISVWVHAKTPDSADIILSTQIGEGDTAQYINLDTKKASTGGGWVELSAPMRYASAGGFITVYVECGNASAEFYIDDFTLSTEGDFAGDVISSNWIGSFEDFDVEFWSDSPNSGSMTLTGGGTFECQFTGGNILFRTGKKLGSVMPYNDYGDIVIDYEAIHNITSGSVSYLTVYGWTVDPLMEWYIVENHGSYRPGKDLQGQIEVDGILYNVYTDTRVEQPSIQGTKTFQQIFSIAVDKRTEGTITVSDHFKAWEDLGLDVSGNLYEVTMCVEGYHTNGNAAITKLELVIGDDVYK